MEKINKIKQTKNKNRLLQVWGQVNYYLNPPPKFGEFVV
jgi:hypothetical protein